MLDHFLNERVHLFSSNQSCYLYERNSNTINLIPKDFFDKLQRKKIGDGDFDKKDYKILDFLLKQPTPEFVLHDEKKCYVTINFSSMCNMSCSYCYRNKNSKKMDSKTLEDIFYYVTHIYYPNAKEYVFSVSLTSEPFMDLELINKLDELIANSEGFLINESDILNDSEEIILQELCSIVGTTINPATTKIEQINNILKNYNLYNFFTSEFLDTIDPYFYNYVKDTEELCLSKRVQIIRQM